MESLAGQLNTVLNQVTIPDLWQQEAVAALRSGMDAVVQAPTGAGKTLIFELWSNQGRNHRQAIYTVPTRALANDKLAEWRRRGWNVGIATGDLAENLDAPILVATLETQKQRLIRGDGPALLVVDEYQMIGDADRGLNYELALAMAPANTQLLLLSGSVENPQNIVEWLVRLGRQAVLIRHTDRPVPLEEVHVNHLNYHVPSAIRGYWPRFVAKALADDLGPILIFAPRRKAAESIAAELARQLPVPDPLSLSAEQKGLLDDALVKMLKSRVVYHHSGLSYGARAGVIEPLAKAGQLRVVVATMGLAAGINFSLRSVALAGDSYRRDQLEQPLRADEILQMFGRAGRRGIDETGYVLISANGIRMREAYPARLSRSGMVDWSTLLNVMSAAMDRGKTPFREAVRVQDRLFTTKPIFLGVELSMKHPDAPCALPTDSERARHVRRRVREMKNSAGEWQPMPRATPVEAGQVRTPRASTPTLEPPPTPPSGAPVFRPVLSVPEALEKLGSGILMERETTSAGPIYCRRMTIAEKTHDGRLFLVKWVRRLTGTRGRQVTETVWKERVIPALEQKLISQKTPLIRFESEASRVHAVVDLSTLPMRVPVDRHGVALWRPEEREVLPADCADCRLIAQCREIPTSTGVALLWRRLGLVDAAGAPTWRGRITSFFSHGNGLAIAVGLEDESYPIDELVYDLADLDAGYRFCGDDNRWGGRLAERCHAAFGMQSIPGYLENGVPIKYGWGAEQIVAAVHRNPSSKNAWTTETLGVGDIDRIIIEWRSLLRQTWHAPDLDWKRWLDLKEKARRLLDETESPTLTDLPPLEYHQTKRIEHRLMLRR